PHFGEEADIQALRVAEHLVGAVEVCVGGDDGHADTGRGCGWRVYVQRGGARARCAAECVQAAISAILGPYFCIHPLITGSKADFRVRASQKTEGKSVSSSSPKSGAEPRTELTLRGIALGVVITLVFTAANVFFGLKIGLTVATSIPAAVISMALLRGFKDSTIQENNIVQTVASAAGTLSAMCFVLPGLLMVGWWTGFPFWTSFAICALGGILGVMYSIPLRRALVTGSDLPYPEGVACAEVLKVGSGDKEHAADVEHGRAGLLAVLWGSIVSAVFIVVEETHIFASDVAQTFR